MEDEEEVEMGWGEESDELDSSFKWLSSSSSPREGVMVAEQGCEQE